MTVEQQTSETEHCPTCKSSSQSDRKQVAHGGYGSNANKIEPCTDYWHRIGAGIPPDLAPSMPVELRASKTYDNLAEEYITSGELQVNGVNARIAVRLFAVWLDKRGAPETSEPPASAEGCTTCGGSGWIGCECPVCTPEKANGSQS